MKVSGPILSAVLCGFHVLDESLPPDFDERLLE
jgi:hypothetical protein